jgi:hypothetical protein
MKNGKFSKMTNEVLLDKNLSKMAKLLHCRITDLANNGNGCWAHDGYLSTSFNVNISTIKRALKELREKQYIMIEGNTSKRIIKIPETSDKNVLSSSLKNELSSSTTRGKNERRSSLKNERRHIYVEPTYLEPDVEPSANAEASRDSNRNPGVNPDGSPNESFYAGKVADGTKRGIVKNSKGNSKRAPKKVIPEFNWDNYLDGMFHNVRRHIRVIALYFGTKEISFPSYETVREAINRMVPDATWLADFSDDDLIKAFKEVDGDKFLEGKWTLATVRKYLSK